MLVLVALAAVLPGTAGAAGRHQIKANVDYGGGVFVANARGGYYMGRLFPGWTFDRQGSWQTGANRSSYAWSFAYGASNACLYVGPSRGKPGWTSGRWATPARRGGRDRCSESQRRFLGGNNGTKPNIASHSNCPPHRAAHGTEKVVLRNAPVYWNLDWGNDYRGGPLRNQVGSVGRGQHIWYRYTTRDGRAIVAFVPGTGWTFLPIGVVNRSRTGYWSAPGGPRRSCGR